VCITRQHNPYITHYHSHVTRSWLLYFRPKKQIIFFPVSSATASSVLCGSLPLLLYITLYGILGFPPANPHRGLASTCNRSLKLLASPLKGEDKSIAVRRESSFQSQKSCGQLYIVRVRHTTRFVSFADLLQYFSLANMIRQCFTN
jgi:hypothetical protein